MKIITISDSHGQHHDLKLPSGDMLIHAGDVTSSGTKTQVLDFLQWYGALNYKYKIFIAGNHDFYFEQAGPEEIKQLIPDDVIYLNDSGVVINGLHIWGSPVQPWFYDWAFNKQRGAAIRQHWELIPMDTDILITHGPAHSVLDLTQGNELAGCFDLLEVIKEVKPKVHVSGHIHEGYGQINLFGVKFINASVLDENYILVKKPICFKIA